MSLRISLLIQGVLDLIGMDFLMAARKEFPPEVVNIVRGRGHRQITQEMFSQLNISPLVNPDSFPRLRETLVIE